MFKCAAYMVALPNLLSSPYTDLFQFFIRVRLCSTQGFCICCSPQCTSFPLTIYLHPLFDLSISCSSFLSQAKLDFPLEAFSKDPNQVNRPPYCLTCIKAKHTGVDITVAVERDLKLISYVRILFHLSCFLFWTYYYNTLTNERVSSVIINSKFIYKHFD